MIESISLRNFKRHTSLDVDFPPGLTLITGSNYSGKSTLLHAILFAFWGVSAVPGGGKRITTRGVAASKTSVTLRFYLQDHAYLIERQISAARLFKDDEPVATGLSGVARELEHIIGVPPKFFLHLKYAAQGDTQALLTLGAAELHKIIEHVSGAGLVNRVIARASTMTTSASAALAAMGDIPDPKGIENQIAAANVKIAEMQDQQGKVRQAIQFLEVTLSEYRIELQDAAAVNAAIGLYHHKMDQLISNKNLVEAQLKRDQALVDKHKSDPGLAQELSTKATKMQAARSALEQAEQTFNTVNNRLKVAEAELSFAERRAQAAAKEVEQTPNPDTSQASFERTELLGLSAKLRERLHANRKAQKESVCPTCHRPFADQASVESLIEEEQSVADQFRNCESRLNAVNDLLSQQKAQQETCRTVRQELDAAQGSLNMMVQRITGLKAEATEAAARLESCRKEGAPTQGQVQEAITLALAERDKATRYNAAVGALNETRRQMSLQQAALDKLCEETPAGEVRDLTELRQTLEAQEKELSESKHRLTLLTYEIRSSAEQMGSNQRGLKNVQDDLAAQAKHLAVKQSSSQLVKYLRDNRDRFMQELWGQVTGYASEFAASCTGGTITGLARTAEGSFTFSEGGYEDSVLTASGSQKSIMALGVQLALDTLLPDTLGALLLDEPTADMDTEHATALTYALAGAGRQIIVVSHRGLDASVADAHIHLG